MFAVHLFQILTTCSFLFSLPCSFLDRVEVVRQNDYTPTDQVGHFQELLRCTIPRPRAPPVL